MIWLARRMTALSFSSTSPAPTSSVSATSSARRSPRIVPIESLLAPSPLTWLRKSRMSFRKPTAHLTFRFLSAWLTLSTRWRSCGLSISTTIAPSSRRSGSQKLRRRYSSRRPFIRSGGGRMRSSYSTNGHSKNWLSETPTSPLGTLYCSIRIDSTSGWRRRASAPAELRSWGGVRGGAGPVYVLALGQLAVFVEGDPQRLGEPRDAGLVVLGEARPPLLVQE